MTPQIKSIYKWYKNPIKWMKEYRTITVMQALMDYEWEHGMKEEVMNKISKSILELPNLFQIK